MTPRIAGHIACLAVLSTLASGGRVNAQGNSAFGHAHGGGHVTAPSAAGGSSSASGSAGEGQPAGDLRSFGTWLDDASVMSPGTGFVTLGFAYWRAQTMREFDLPVIDTGIAIAPRVQVGMSVPYYYAHEPGSALVKGLGNLYLTTKLQVADPASHRPGVAVTPMLEVLDAQPSNGGSRMNWALPVNVELRQDGWRAFGSGGYFSRGAVFASGAVEAALSRRAWVTGSVSETYSTRAPIDPMALPRAQTDVTAGLTVVVAPNVSVYGNVGHTLSDRAVNGGTVNVAAGVSLNLPR
jgi:hypothetical protein